ncbi:MAG: hypothetical protein IJM48_08335 [Treponema sp.]|nr:hypothetical protein [Treponema sp.]
MSKKTEQIYKTISILEDLQNQISIMNQLAKAKGQAGEENHHLENIEFEMAQAIKSLRFWIGSLYSYNGKSTSRAKVAASQENGKKGGRPPKKITELKKRREELEDKMLPELRREKSVTTDLERESQLEEEISEYENELFIIEEKLERWHEEKNLK